MRWRRIAPIVIVVAAAVIIYTGIALLWMTETVSYRYTVVDGMDCIVFTDIGVTCNWNTWNGNKEEK